MQRTDRGGPQAAGDAAEWSRLMRERAEYWKAEAEKRTAEADRDGGGSK